MAATTLRSFKIRLLAAAVLLMCVASTARAQKVGAIAPKRTAPVPPHNADTFGHYTPKWRRWPHDWAQPVMPRSQAAPKPVEPTKPAEDVPKPDAKQPADEMPPPPSTKEPAAPPAATPATPDEAPLTAPTEDEAPLTAPMDDALPPLEIEPPDEPGAMPDDQALPPETEPAPTAEPEGLDDLPPLDLDDGAPAAPPGVENPQSRHRAPARRSAATGASASRTQRGGVVGRWPLKPVEPDVSVDNSASAVRGNLRRGDAVAPTHMASAQPKRPRKFVPANDVERLPPVDGAATAGKRRPLAAKPSSGRGTEQASWTAAAPAQAPSAPAGPSNPLRKSASEGWQSPASGRLQANPLRSAG